jgi:capsular polysaccharide biosynthesis protein
MNLSNGMTTGRGRPRSTPWKVTAILVGGGLLGAAAGAGTYQAIPQSYTSSSSLYVSVVPGPDLNLANSSQLIETRGRSYAQLIGTTQIEALVLEELGERATGTALDFQGSYSTGTALINVTAESDSAVVPVAAFDALATVMQRQIQRLDASSSSSEGRVGVELALDPSDPTISLSQSRAVGLGGAGGVIVAGALAYVMAHSRSNRP